MANLTRLQDLMLDSFVEQPKFNVGPFIVCNRPSSNYPNHAITIFCDDNDWGRIAYALKEEENRPAITQITKPKDIFIEEPENLKEILKKEAKESEAIVLFNRIRFPNDPEIQMDVILNALMHDTFAFMMNYYAYQDYILHKRINDSHKKSR